MQCKEYFKFCCLQLCLLRLFITKGYPPEEPSCVASNNAQLPSTDKLCFCMQNKQTSLGSVELVIYNSEMRI